MDSVKLEHIIPEPDRDGLRRFGLVTGGILAGLFGLLLPWLFGHAWPLWPWVVFVALGTLALAIPEGLRPVYKAWMKFGLLASKITTPLILGIVFFLVVSPMGFVKRFVGRDAMARKFEDSKSTYRVPSEQRPAQNLERPF